MEDQIFDNIIREKLQHAAPPPMAAGSWEQLSQRLDGMEFHAERSTELDDLARRKLAAREVPLAPRQWDQLAARLDRTHTLISRLRTAKIAEAAILVLTLLNLDAFQSEPARWQKPDTRTNEPIAAATAPANVDQAATSTIYTTTTAATFTTDSGAQSAEKSELNAAATASQQSVSASGHAQGSAMNSSGLLRKNGTVAPARATTTETAVSVTSANTTIAAAQSGAHGTNQVVGSDATGADATVSTASPLSQEAAASLTAAQINTDKVAPIGTLSAQMLDGVERTLSLKVPVFVTQNKPFRSVSLLAHAGPDFLRVSGDNNTSTRGYTAGLAIAKRQGKWGVEAGLEYASIKYATKPTKEILGGNPSTGQIGRSLRSLDFDIVQLPVRLTRSLFKRKGTEVLAVAGGSVLASVQVSPDYNELYIPGSSPDPSATIKPLRTITPLASKGLFEGGTAAENLHLTANAGLRIEQYIGAGSKRLFVEINGQKLITTGKLGPADDSFTGIGLRTGLLAQL